MLSSGDFNKVLAVLNANREIYLEKHREDKLTHDVFKKRSSVKILLGNLINAFTRQQKKLHIIIR